MNEKLIEIGEFIHESLLNGSSKTNPAFDEAMLLFVCNSLELLKDQEAVEPYSMNAERTYGICPRCGKIIFRYGNVEENHYCGVCGKKVKWNDRGT